LKRKQNGGPGGVAEPQGYKSQEKVLGLFILRPLPRQLSPFTFTKMMTRIIAIASLVASAAAHFTLDYPLTRGFDEVRVNGSFRPHYC
jgi:hypothetical protein